MKYLLLFLLLPISSFSVEKWSCGYNKSKTVSNSVTGVMPPMIQKKEDGSKFGVRSFIEVGDCSEI